MIPQAPDPRTPCASKDAATAPAEGLGFRSLKSELAAISVRVEAWRSEQMRCDTAVPRGNLSQGSGTGANPLDTHETMMKERLRLMRLREQERALLRTQRLIPIIEARLDACRTAPSSACAAGKDV